MLLLLKPIVSYFFKNANYDKKPIFVINSIKLKKTSLVKRRGQGRLIAQLVEVAGATTLRINLTLHLY